ncbi:hypothetical protein N7539_002913 [Penicillium diatomitis]|uniref:Zn(2)-C6 fungal-type domain-containing protein n=1 Tax=Penicillium diatomitis TaxID=2819901 RepID=A0A9W9XFM0_9EURO|nr:uncharacterized protein N7539_002913 [Penicillium diatomitis]KAJ5491346.1 hypothetical protein N7539_002913 [Penicillium diatomitis]
MVNHLVRPGNGLVPIAPTPVQADPLKCNETKSGKPAMSYSCQTCARRKVKCDKIGPVCSRCRKGGYPCSFEAPQPKPRKRKLDEVLEKMAHYECLLKEHGLLDAGVGYQQKESPLTRNEKGSPPGPASPISSKTGRLLTGPGRSRYIDSHMWLNLEDEEIRHISTDKDEDEDEHEGAMTTNPVWSEANPQDPLTGAFLGYQKSISYFHPSHMDAMQLWETYVRNVEPICKILHVPSTRKMVDAISQEPEIATKAEECLLFSIYHCAIFSITDEDCKARFHQNRSDMMKLFHAAVRQALVNASFLRTTEIAVLQALHLYLLSSRDAHDPHTYWILTGVSARVGQRIGLHRDGEGLGLPPFEVETRRRLFYQIFPHDSRAGQSAGIDNISLPQGWDTKPPLNINDDQIWPEMSEKPVEQIGATDMIFCLSRAYMGKRLAGAGALMSTADSWSSSDYQKAEKVILAAESEVEEKFIRYCDMVNPLHFLTIGLARSGMTAMRLKFQLPKLRKHTATDEERKAIFQLARKNLDTDAAVHSHGGISRFQWHTKPFFLWGTRDSMVVVLMTLLKWRDLLSQDQIEAAWTSVAELYHHHEELFDSRQALSVAMGRLAVRAWDSWRPSDHPPEPEFISKLRTWRKAPRRSQQLCDVPTHSETVPSLPNPQCSASAFPDLDEFNGVQDLDVDFNIDDWVSWDQLLRDHRN